MDVQTSMPVASRPVLVPPSEPTAGCPTWCTCHDADEHFGLPLLIDSANEIILLGLEQRGGQVSVSVTVDDGESYVHLDLTLADSHNLAATLADLTSLATSPVR